MRRYDFPVISLCPWNVTAKAQWRKGAIKVFDVVAESPLFAGLRAMVSTMLMQFERVH